MKKLRSTVLFLASLLMASASFAAPVLRPSVVVKGDIVTFGDMFDDAGAHASAPLFRAPKPGTSGFVALSQITDALNRNGVAIFDANGLNGSQVTRDAALINEATLSELISENLYTRGIAGREAQIRTFFTAPLAPMYVEANAEPVRLLNLQYQSNGAFLANFAIAGYDAPISTTGTIEISVLVPHIRASLPAGAIISEADVELKPVPMKYVSTTGVVALEDIVGKSLVRQSREGMMLKASDVAAPQLIGKNDPVTIFFKHGPMTLTVKGQAVTSAPAGGTIQVLNLLSKRVITATAISSGAVQVTATTLAVAGL